MQPDILLIMPDQMRADCMGIAGHPNLLTPNIDALGRGGCHFRRAYSTCPSCIPARRALLTGQFPATNGSVGFATEPFDTPTLPGILTEHGYATHLVGRNMHQSEEDQNPGYGHCRLGSTYVRDDDYARLLDVLHPQLGGIRGMGIDFNGWQSRTWPLEDHLHPTSWAVNESRKVIAGRDDGAPLLLTTSFYAPHPPLLCPEFHFRRYLDMDLPPRLLGDWASPAAAGHEVDSPRVDLSGEALRQCRAAYYGLINHIDDQLTWLIKDFTAASRRAGRPWLIVFTTDHGEMLGDHYYFRKCEPYEGSAAIPFLIRSQGLGQQPGRVDDVPVCLEDVLPTCLDAAGIPLPAQVDGISLLPSLRGAAREPRRLHCEHNPCYSREQAFQMLCDGRHKYIWRPCTGDEQLFDLASDPGELHDLGGDGDHDGLMAALRLELVDRLDHRPEGFVCDGALSVVPDGYPPILRR